MGGLPCESIRDLHGNLRSMDLSNDRGVDDDAVDMKESKEFAGELFDALTRRKGGRKVEAISEDELYEYWVQISDQSFDSRMQIFFDL